MQPQLAGAHARLGVHVLGILNHAMVEHWPNRDSATPNSLPRAIKVRYLMPALLHSPGGRTKRRQRFALVGSGDIVLALPWLIVYTRREDLRQRHAAQEASIEAKFERASSEGVEVAARSLLAEPRSAGNEGIWNTLVAKSPPKTTPPCPRRRRLQCWRAPPRWKVERLPRGALTMSTHSRCSSTSSAPGAPSLAPETKVNDLLIYNPSFTPTSAERSSDGV